MAVAVGGAAVGRCVGGTGVGDGGTKAVVGVERANVAVGGKGVFVGGANVAVGGKGVSVGGASVAVAVGAGVAVRARWTRVGVGIAGGMCLCRCRLGVGVGRGRRVAVGGTIVSLGVGVADGRGVLVRVALGVDVGGLAVAVGRRGTGVGVKVGSGVDVGRRGRDVAEAVAAGEVVAVAHVGDGVAVAPPFTPSVPAGGIAVAGQRVPVSAKHAADGLGVPATGVWVRVGVGDGVATRPRPGRAFADITASRARISKPAAGHSRRRTEAAPGVPGVAMAIGRPRYRPRSAGRMRYSQPERAAIWVAGSAPD